MSDPGSDLTDDLRRVLRQDPGTRTARDSDDLLARVHAGAARRRTRRAATVGLVAAAAATAVFTVAVPSADRSPDVPSAADSAESGVAPAPAPAPEPGTPVAPTDVRVGSVTWTSAEEFWVLGDASCGEGQCTVVGHTANAARSPLRFSAGPDVSASDATFRMANDRDGWVVSEGRLYATHDRARSWKPVEAPMESVEDVDTSRASVWLTGRDGASGRTVVVTGAADKDTFTDAKLPPELSASELLSDSVLTAGEQGSLFGFMRAGEEYAEFVGYEGAVGEWRSYPTDSCLDAPSLSSVADAMWAICTRAEESLPMVSTDFGRTWRVVEVDMGLGDDPRIAAIDTESALISTGVELYVLTGDQLDRADPPAEGAGSKTYDYLGFDDIRNGLLIDSDGILSRSASGGASWEPVELP